MLQFPARTAAPLTILKESLELRILVDWSWVEVFAMGGRVAITNLVFPKSGAQGIEFGQEGKLSDDEAMIHIAAMPRLRRLRAQESVATDKGFAALSRSKSLEFIWGRECPNFTGRGLVSLSKMPARGLGIGCRKVDDKALSTLPRFPALRELTPIAVKDEGFRHVGRCTRTAELYELPGHHRCSN